MHKFNKVDITKKAFIALLAFCSFIFSKYFSCSELFQYRRSWELNSPPFLQKQPPQVFFKKRCSQKFQKISGNMCQSNFFNEVAGLSNSFLKNTNGRLHLFTENLHLLLLDREKLIHCWPIIPFNVQENLYIKWER